MPATTFHVNVLLTSEHQESCRLTRHTRPKDTHTLTPWGWLYDYQSREKIDEFCLESTHIHWQIKPKIDCLKITSNKWNGQLCTPLSNSTGWKVWTPTPSLVLFTCWRVCHYLGVLREEVQLIELNNWCVWQKQVDKEQVVVISDNICNCIQCILSNIRRLSLCAFGRTRHTVESTQMEKWQCLCHST